MKKLSTENKQNSVKIEAVRVIGEGASFVRNDVLPKNTRIMGKAEAARRLEVSYSTVKRLCQTGILRTTVDGKIIEQSLIDYLGG